jgi:hypothetical protein
MSMAMGAAIALPPFATQVHQAHGQVLAPGTLNITKSAIAPVGASGGSAVNHFATLEHVGGTADATTTIEDQLPEDVGFVGPVNVVALAGPVRVFIGLGPAAFFAGYVGSGTGDLNVWVDGNRDGDWADVKPCPGVAGPIPAFEHIVIDLPVSLGALGMGVHTINVPTRLVIVNGALNFDPLSIRFKLDGGRLLPSNRRRRPHRRERLGGPPAGQPHVYRDGAAVLRRRHR